MADLSPAERDDLLRSLALVAAHQFEEDLATIEARLVTYEPRSLLAHLSFYFLTVESETGPSPPGYPRLMQHHIEVLQALMLAQDQISFAWMPTFPDLIDTLERLDRASHAFYVRRLTPQSSPEQQARLWAQEEMRSHTQAVRNWGYPDQMWRIVTDLFAPLDDRIEAATGVRVASLIEMCQRVFRTAEKRIRAHVERLRPLLQADTVPELFQAHHGAYPDLRGSPEEMEQFRAALLPSLTLDELKELLISHLNLRLPDVYTFTLDDFLAAYPGAVERDKLKTVLERWSLAFGALQDHNAADLFLSNPIWTRPLISLGDDQFFCPILGLLQSFCLELMEEVLGDESGLQKRYQDHRSSYLEREVERLFREAFPSAQIYRGSKYRRPQDPAVEYENDLLVLLDTYAMVVETKSRSVSDAASQGKPERLEREIRTMLVEPAEQATRFAEYLRVHPGPHQFRTKQKTVNEVDARDIRTFVRLSVTLDQLGRLYSRWPALRDGGFVKPSVDLVPTLALVDLESIFDVLEGECQRIHYLVRRGEFERNKKYVGGELDLLAFYLDSGFNLGDLEFSDDALLLIGAATRLNPYLMRRTTGANPPRPRLRLTTWWRDIVRRLEARQQPCWTDLGVALLSVAHEEQERFEQRFAATRHSVATQWQVPGHEDVVFFSIGPEQWRGVLAGLACRQTPVDDLPDLVGVVAERAIELVESLRWGVVIVVDVVASIYPYRAVVYIDDPTHRKRC